MHHAGPADHGGHAEADATDCVGSLNLAGYRQNSLAIERDAINDFFDCHADGPSGAAFARDDFGAALLRALENFRLESGGDAGEFQQRETVHCGRGPDGQHAVAMFAEDHGAHLRRGEIEFRGDERAETGAVEHGAETDDLLPGQAQTFDGELGEDVNRVGDDKDDRAFFEPGLFEAVEDAVEEADVAIDKIQTRLVWLAAESGRDANHIGLSAIGVVAGGDFLIRAISGAMQEVKCLAFGGRLVGVEDDQVLDDA